MSTKTIQISDAIHDYILSVGVRDREILRRLREETSTMPMSVMQISPEQGQFFSLLIPLIGAKNALEVGTFTGYSALCVALALPEDGRLTACDVSDEWTAVARRYWEEAGVAHKVDLKIAPAEESLSSLLSSGRADTFDFAFIDADKTRYDTYYELCLKLVRKGGLIAIDNVLRGGTVIDPASQDENVRAVRKLNQKIHEDERVDISLVPIGDGLTLVRKR